MLRDLLKIFLSINRDLYLYLCGGDSSLYLSYDPYSCIILMVFNMKKLQILPIINSQLGKWVLKDSTNHVYGYFETKHQAEVAKDIQLKKINKLFLDFK